MLVAFGGIVISIMAYMSPFHPVCVFISQFCLLKDHAAFGGFSTATLSKLFTPLWLFIDKFFLRIHEPVSSGVMDYTGFIAICVIIFG